MLPGRLTLCFVLAAPLLACGSAAETTSSVEPSPTPKTSSPEPTPAPKPTPVSSPKKPVAKAKGAPYPIILMHGMGGFNELENLPLDVSYFNGVQADLEAQGVKNVFVTVAPPFDTSENRASALKPQIESILAMTGAAKVNLIGHSQGGLDARVLASPEGLGMGDVIASVTTVATPHRGSPVADLALGLVSGVPAATVSAVTDGFLQLLEDGVYSIKTSPNLLAQGTEMTTSYMASTFNPKYKDAHGVVYASYAGRTNLESGTGECDDGEYANEPQSVDVPQALLAATADYIQAQGMDNDGLVPVSSAKWGTFMECVPADHLKEVGMLFQNGADPVSGFDHLLFFRSVVARLQAEGF
jgi:triacylglycerol lipase